MPEIATARRRANARFPSVWPDADANAPPMPPAAGRQQHSLDEQDDKKDEKKDEKPEEKKEEKKEEKSSRRG
jgi:ribosomal protein L12E/L44/L45/RPP1/RPP2